MRHRVALSIAGLFVFMVAAVLRADDSDKTRAVVDKALKAIGGEDKLEKLKAQTWKEKGTYYGMGDGVPYTANYSSQWPGQFRMEIVGFFTVVLDGDKGWMKMNDDTTEMNAEQLAEQKESHYAGYVTTLTPLKDKAFTLSPLDEVQVNGRAAEGVKVTHKNHRDVNLFFDKENGLLIKSDQRAKDLENGGKEVLQEAFYSDFKDIDGIKIPMKIVIKRDGKQFVEAEHSDVKLVEKLDKSVFAKP